MGGTARFHRAVPSSIVILFVLERGSLLLVQERSHPVSLILGLEAAAEQLLLDHDSLVDGNLQSLIHGLLGGTHSNRSIAGNLGGKLLCAGRSSSDG